MKLRFLVFSLLAAGSTSWAQNLDSLKHASIAGRPVVGITYSQSWATNAFAFNQLIDFQSTTTITPVKKEAWMNQFMSTNSFGLDQEMGFYFKDPADSARAEKRYVGWGVAHRTLVYGDFSKNLAELFLYGNKRFAGQNLDLKQADYAYWNFTELYYDQVVLENEKHEAHFQFGVMIGHQYERFDLDKGTLYTAPDGEYIDANLDYRYERSDSDQVGFFSFNGLGLNLRYQHIWKYSPTKSVKLVLKDIGIMAWNSNSLHLQVDSSFRFRGLEVANLFDLNDSLLAQQGENLEDAFFSRQRRALYRFLPPLVSVAWMKEINTGIWTQWGLGVNYRVAASMLPQLQGWASWKNGKSRGFLGASVGGYNLWGIDVGYAWKIIPRLEFEVQASGFNSLLLPGLSYGLGVQTGLQFEL